MHPLVQYTALLGLPAQYRQLFTLAATSTPMHIWQKEILPVVAKNLTQEMSCSNRYVAKRRHTNTEETKMAKA